MVHQIKYLTNFHSPNYRKLIRYKSEYKQITLRIISGLSVRVKFLNSSYHTYSTHKWKEFVKNMSPSRHSNIFF